MYEILQEESIYVVNWNLVDLAQW